MDEKQTNDARRIAKLESDNRALIAALFQVRGEVMHAKSLGGAGARAQLLVIQEVANAALMGAGKGDYAEAAMDVEVARRGLAPGDEQMWMVTVAGVVVTDRFRSEEFAREHAADLRRSIAARAGKIAHVEPLPAVLRCPECKEPHVDRGEFAAARHRTHRCEACKHEWRPSQVATVGVPGAEDARLAWARYVRAVAAVHGDDWLQDVRDEDSSVTYDAGVAGALLALDALLGGADLPAREAQVVEFSVESTNDLLSRVEQLSLRCGHLLAALRSVIVTMRGALVEIGRCEVPTREGVDRALKVADEALVKFDQIVREN